jgi:hypothetical protein
MVASICGNAQINSPEKELAFSPDSWRKIDGEWEQPESLSLSTRMNDRLRHH